MDFITNRCCLKIRSLQLSFWMLLFLLTISCSTHPIKPASKIKWTPCQPSAELDASLIQQWNLQCGSIDVPLDYDNPDGTQIRLALAKRPAVGAGNFIGTVITNPGGPGGSGISDLANADGYAAIFQGYFDQVSFEPRGIGLSEPYISCHADGVADQLNGANYNTDDMTYGFPLAINATKGIWQQCEANFAPVLPFMGTLNVARDLDRIRIALGEDKINYVGYSYGTLVGSMYATLFPNNFRAMVLDGSIPAHTNLYDSGIDSAIAEEETLDRMLNECNYNPNCPLYDPLIDGNPTMVFESLLSQLAGAPLANAHYGNLQGLTQGWFLTAVADGLASDWAGLTEGIYEASMGDGSMLLEQGATSVGRNPDGTYDNSNEMYDIVQCVDFNDRPDTTLVTNLKNELVDVAPNMGPYAVRISSILCIGTSVPQLPPTPVPPVQIKGIPPILVIGNINDPETPYSWGQSLVSAIEGAVLLTWDGGGHTVFAEGISDCIDNITVNYLVNLVTPATATACPPIDPWADDE